MINYRLSKFNFFGDCSYLYKSSFSGFKKNIKHFRWFYKNKIENIQLFDYIQKHFNR